MARGLCSPEQRAACPLTEHYTDRHHTYYPASAYKTKIEKLFRVLPENKVQLCRREHNDIHATEASPNKPTRDEMLQAIARAAVEELPHVEETERPAVCERRSDAITTGTAA